MDIFKNTYEQCSGKAFTCFFYPVSSQTAAQMLNNIQNTIASVFRKYEDLHHERYRHLANTCTAQDLNQFIRE